MSMNMYCMYYLKQRQILMIDEATANVDQRIDWLLQNVIVDKFQNFKTEQY